MCAFKHLFPTVYQSDLIFASKESLSLNFCELFKIFLNLSCVISPTSSAPLVSNIFTSISGNSIGIKVKYTGSGANATIYYGDSFIDRMTNYIDEILNSSNSILTNRVTRLNKEVSNQNVELSDLNTQFESIRSRYVSQFTAMEKAVTSLKSTGEYLTNLLEAMNKDD